MKSIFPKSIIVLASILGLARTSEGQERFAPASPAQHHYYQNQANLPVRFQPTPHRGTAIVPAQAMAPIETPIPQPMAVPLSTPAMTSSAPGLPQGSMMRGAVPQMQSSILSSAPQGSYPGMVQSPMAAPMPSMLSQPPIYASPGSMPNDAAYQTPMVHPNIGSLPSVPAPNYNQPSYPSHPMVETYGVAGCDSGGCESPGCDSPGCNSTGCAETGNVVFGAGCDSCGDSSCGGGGLFSKCGKGGGLLSSCGNLLGLGGGLGLGAGAGNDQCQSSYIWGDSEYLFWKTKQRQVPILVTTSPQGTLDTAAGVLGEAGTSVLFGNEEIGDDHVTGYRFTGGVWLNRYQTAGIGVRYFTLDTNDTSFSQTSTNGDPIIARPFTNVDPAVNAEDALLVGYPGVSDGRAFSNAELDVSGLEVFMRYLLYTGYCNRVDVIGGYHHTNVEDSLRIGHILTSVDGITHGAVGTVIDSRDRWEAENKFDGGEIGVLSESCDGRLTWTLLTKVSFGNMKQKMSVRGRTTTTVPGGGSADRNDGLLNLASNIGNYERNEFAIVPEMNVSVAYNLSTNVRVSVGYSLIYWSDVVLANQAIDTVVNPTQTTGGLVGAARPQFVFPESTSFWAQGLTLGFHSRF